MRRRRVERCLAHAASALEAGSVADAGTALDEARRLEPDHPQLADLLTRLRRAEGPSSHPLSEPVVEPVVEQGEVVGHPPESIVPPAPRREPPTVPAAEQLPVATAQPGPAPAARGFRGFKVVENPAPRTAPAFEREAAADPPAREPAASVPATSIQSPAWRTDAGSERLNARKPAQAGEGPAGPQATPAEQPEAHPERAIERPAARAIPSPRPSRRGRDDVAPLDLPLNVSAVENAPAPAHPATAVPSRVPEAAAAAATPGPAVRRRPPPHASVETKEHPRLQTAAASARRPGEARVSPRPRMRLVVAAVFVAACGAAGWLLTVPGPQGSERLASLVGSPSIEPAPPVPSHVPVSADTPAEPTAVPPPDSSAEAAAPVAPDAAIAGIPESEESARSTAAGPPEETATVPRQAAEPAPEPGATLSARSRDRLTGTTTTGSEPPAAAAANVPPPVTRTDVEPNSRTAPAPAGNGSPAAPSSTGAATAPPVPDIPPALPEPPAAGSPTPAAGLRAALPSPAPPARAAAVGAPKPAADTASRDSAAPEAVNPERLVLATLSRYESAYSTLDAAAASAVWPSVDRNALARAFEGLSAQTISLGQCEVRVSGGSARADCAGSARWTPRVGGAPRSASRRWRFDLKNDGASWVIVEASVR